MPQNYSGNPGNITSPISVSITGCANNGAGLIRVTSSTAHDMATNDVVYVSAVTGTTEANGFWPITVVDATHFDLVGSAFVNAYVSGGTAKDLSLSPYFQIPNNGEPGTVESILAAVQALADRTQYLGLLSALGTVIGTPQTITAVGTTNVVWPYGASRALLVGCGGGGSGGGGRTGNTSTGSVGLGGSGGGGAPLTVQLVTGVVGTTYAVAIGAAAAAAAINSNGNDGADLTFGSLATFRGGRKGYAGRLTGTSDTAVLVGGSGVDGTIFGTGLIYLASSQSDWFVPEQAGGLVATRGLASSSNASPGAHSRQGFAGGAGGANGIDDGSYFAGCGSGGGGAGPFGAGGAGARGGNGTSSGTGLDGNAGTGAAANTGAGGGGGSAGGQGSIAGGAGGTSGIGGTGKLLIYWLK